MNYTENNQTIIPNMEQRTEYVDEINHSLAVLMLPVTIFMVILMLVGLCGNLIVVTVLVNKKNKSIANYFMLSLAAIDLISCTLMHPYVIYKLFYFYDSLDVATCKLFEFLIHAGLSVQITVLLSVSIDRYYAVCRPLTFANSHNRALILISCSIVAGVALSIPLLVFYGQNTVWIEVPGIPRGSLSGDVLFVPENVSVNLNNLSKTVELTTQAMAQIFLAADNATFQNRNFDVAAASEYVMKVHICHYSDEFDGSLSQGVFGMIIFCSIISVTVAMSILYILVLKTIMSRHKQVQPSNSSTTSSPVWLASRTNNKTTNNQPMKSWRGDTSPQDPEQHHAVKRKSRNGKSLFRCTVFGLDGIPDHPQECQCFEVVMRRKCNVEKARSNETHTTSSIEKRKGLTQPTEKEKLEDKVQRKSAFNSEDPSNTHAHKNVVNFKIPPEKINPVSCENGNMRTEDCFTTSNNVKKSVTETNVTTRFDSHINNMRNSSWGNISSISNSDVEMTWRSQRVLMEQRNHQQMEFPNGITKQLQQKTVTFDEDNATLDSRRLHRPIGNSNQQTGRSKRKGVIKGVKMLSLVTVVFFVSWLPFLVFKVLMTSNPDVWTDNMIAGNVFANLLNHLFYLNNAINPLIYTFINSNFREECGILFRKVKSKLCKQL